MMIIRHLQYLCALARERHFARAAAVCNVTQSTLSAGIKQLEESLGVLIVERGQRFIGLTEEGERVLAWAQRVLVDYGGLQQELSEMREGMVGQLRIGAIPVTLPIIPLLTSPFAQRHRGTDIVVISQTSIEIQRRLDEFILDAGVTYLDNEPLARVRRVVRRSVVESLHPARNGNIPAGRSADGSTARHAELHCILAAGR